MSNLFNIRAEGNGEISLSPAGNFCGAEIYSLRAVYAEGESPAPFSLTFMTENRDAFSVWSALHRKDRCVYPAWRKDFNVYSDASHGVPLVQFIDKKGQNICLAAVADFTDPISVFAGIDERSGKIEIKIEFFNNLEKPPREYRTFLFCSTERIPYYDAISCFSEYKKSLGYISASVPEIARRRTYSTWYAFQKDVDENRVFEQCMLAKEYGMNTVILDDGWQTPVCGQEGNAYNTCGD